MIAKPTTEQILDDCSRQLMEEVLPAVSDATVQVTIFMMDLVLRNAAKRAAHEIAWMTEEVRQLEGYTGTGGEPPGNGAATSLHLDDVVERYRLASEAFAEALEAAMADGDEERARLGTALLAERVERERDVMCGWSPVGR